MAPWGWELVSHNITSVFVVHTLIDSLFDWLVKFYVVIDQNSFPLFRSFSLIDYQCHFHGFSFSCIILCLILSRCFLHQTRNRSCACAAMCCWGWLGLKRLDWYAPVKVCSIITRRPTAEIQGLSFILSQLSIPSCQSAVCYLCFQTVLPETWDVCPAVRESFLHFPSVWK